MCVLIDGGMGERCMGIWVKCGPTMKSTDERRKRSKETSTEPNNFWHKIKL